MSIPENLSVVTVKDAVNWGMPAEIFGIGNQLSGVQGFSFAGEVGDEVSVVFNSDLPGTAYLLSTGAEGSWDVVAQVDITAPKITKDTTITAPLRWTETYAMAFEVATVPTDTSGHRVEMTLTGKPKSPANQVVLDLRAKWADESDGEADFVALDDKTLKGAAAAAFAKYSREYSDMPPSSYTWTIDGQPVTVVEDVTDGGTFDDFFDASGALIASGSASESEDFSWSK